MSALSVFMSYSWDSDDHVQWVEEFAASLKSDGTRVLLDRWDVPPGADLPRFMEESVRDSDFVILICTPEFAKKSNSRRGGVGYEQSIVTAQILAGAASETKFIPILRTGSPAEAVPTALAARRWLDAREDTARESVLAELRTAFGSPSRPESERDAQTDRPENEDLEVFRQAHEFARSRSGLALPRWKADEFAEECQSDFSLDELTDLVVIFEFANFDMKFSRDDALDMASEWLREGWVDHFDDFSSAFHFLLASDGLKMSASAATDFLEDLREEHGFTSLPRFIEAVETALHLGRSRAEAEEFGLEQL